MHTVEVFAVILLGLILGSLATALSYRLPRGLPVGFSRSQCPSCNKTLSVTDLVPVFSWLFLRGHCRQCKAVISWEYPLTELVTVVLCLALYKTYGLHADTAAVFLLAPILVSILHIDFKYKIIPDVLTLSVVALGVLLLFVRAAGAQDFSAFMMHKGLPAAEGLLIFGGGSWLIRQTAMMIMKKEGMGLGDVKFYAASGFWLGLNPDAIAVFLLISAFSGLAFALLWRKKTGEAEVPFGPALVLGLIVTLFFHMPEFMIR